jgi:D-alanyl-D-alanine carboxypeptidase
MSWGSLSPSRRIALVSVVVALSAAATFSQAEARARHHGKQHAKQHRVIHGPDYRPPYAEFVLDANSGDMLREVNADEPRHPASLTKIMTLYLLFEQLEAGKFKLDTPLRACRPPATDEAWSQDQSDDQRGGCNQGHVHQIGK